MKYCLGSKIRTLRSLFVYSVKLVTGYVYTRLDLDWLSSKETVGTSETEEIQTPKFCVLRKRILVLVRCCLKFSVFLNDTSYHFCYLPEIFQWDFNCRSHKYLITILGWEWHVGTVEEGIQLRRGLVVRDVRREFGYRELTRWSVWPLHFIECPYGGLKRHT